MKKSLKDFAGMLAAMSSMTRQQRQRVSGIRQVARFICANASLVFP